MSNAHRPARAKPPRAAVALLAGLALAAAALAGAAGVFGQDLQSQLDDKQAQLDKANSREGVLSTTIQRTGEQLDQLRGEVATLRNREAIVQAELEKKEAELKQAKDRLAVLRVRLKRSLRVLRERLVAIYESSSPDALTVILNSDGFDELLSRYEYLQRIQSQDTSIAERVRTLRDETKDTVERVRAARDEIAAKRAELASTRSLLEAREGNLAVARIRTSGLWRRSRRPSRSSRATSATFRRRFRLSSKPPSRASRRCPPGRSRARARRGSSGQSTARSPRRSASSAPGRAVIRGSTSPCPAARRFAQPPPGRWRSRGRSPAMATTPASTTEAVSPPAMRTKCRSVSLSGSTSARVR